MQLAAIKLNRDFRMYDSIIFSLKYSDNRSEHRIFLFYIMLLCREQCLPKEVQGSLMLERMDANFRILCQACILVLQVCQPCSESFKKFTFQLCKPSGPALSQLDKLLMGAGITLLLKSCCALRWAPWSSITWRERSLSSHGSARCEGRPLLPLG